MSIAFLTLILGFLLGKSTSDRHHLIREHNRRQNELILRSPQDIDKIEIALINSAKAKLSTVFEEYYLEQHLTINKQLKENLTQCIDSTTFDTSQEDLEDFLRHLIREEYNSFIKCADNLIKFLQNIQRNDE